MHYAKWGKKEKKKQNVLLKWIQKKLNNLKDMKALPNTHRQLDRIPIHKRKTSHTRKKKH
ncbi:hypothetical protein B398_05595 [Xylella fastidiosa 32]|nr:hypothetical protein B398_05595 [Xylella fastidiosa 32]